MLISDWSSDVCSSDLLHLLAQRLEAALGHPVSLDEIREGRYAEAAAAITVATATDGNHGRSVAWGARLAGCRCRIYIHAKVSENRKRAMERSEAHTSELQSLMRISYAVFCLKKKT